MSEGVSPQQVIIHAGFHKTGTTSIQAMIERERNRLEAFAQFYIKSQVDPSPNIARLYGQRQNRHTLTRFESTFTVFLKTCPRGKPIVISREQLCGALLTGRGRWPFRQDRYHRVSLKLAQAQVRSVIRVFGPDAQITLVYTVRDDAGYIRSAYGHFIRDTDLDVDFDTFRKGFRRKIDLQGCADRIAKALPTVTVKTATLSDLSAHVRGPGQLILDILDIPQDIQDKIAAPAKRNKPGISDALAAQLLALNKADMRASDRKRAKHDLISAERKALHGW